MRIKFLKGQQRKFLKKVLVELNCPSLKELSVRLDVPYSTLKNYFVEQRFIPDVLFDNLCFLAKINPDKLGIELLENNWGNILGGKTSRR